MEKLSYVDFLTQITQNIKNYKKNVIDQTYTNDLEELQTLMDDLKSQTDAYFKENQLSATPEVMERVASEVQEAMDYVSLIASETERFIKMDQSLSSSDSEVLLLQNTYIKNMSLLDEVNIRLHYYEKASKKLRTKYLKQMSEEQANAYFTVCLSGDDRKKYITNEYASDYQKLAQMARDLHRVLYQDQKKMQSLYNQQVKNAPAIEMGEIVAPSIDPSLRLMTDENIQTRAQDILREISKYDQAPGMKEKYHFNFEEKEYTVIVPLGKKALFEKNLRELAGLRDVLKERQEMPLLAASSHYEVARPEEFVDIQIDEDLLKGMTLQQKLSYLQSIMLRIEGLSEIHMMQVEDLKGNVKSIPAYYYKVYRMCIDHIITLSLSIDENYVASLNDEQKITYYQKLMERILNHQEEPFVVIDGKPVSARYYAVYVDAKERLSKMQTYRLESHPLDEEMVGYTIDEEYANTLSEELKLSYYSNLIGRISSCNIMPKVSFEAFGKQMEVPEKLLPTAVECEKRVKDSMAKMDLRINEMEVLARVAEMQFAYYGKLIEKMKASKLGPKTRVEAFGESFEIPYECVDTFQECLKRMDDIKASFAKDKGVQQKEEKPKVYQIEDKKKPKTNKIKEFLSKIPGKVKVAMLTAAFAITAFGSFQFGRHFGNENANENANTISTQEVTKPVDTDDVLSLIDEPVEVVEEAPSNEVEDSGKIDEWVASAKQSIASKFGSTFTVIDPNRVYNSPDRLDQPLRLKAGFDQSTYTITKITLKKADGTKMTIGYRDMNAQEVVDELLRNGAVIDSVHAVSSIGEEDYKQNGIDTAVFTVDNMDHMNYANASATTLSQEILNTLNQGRGMNH